MKEQYISVIIAERPYRLSVNSEKEEAVFREASKLIKAKMQEYASNFAFRDKQDLLAMVVLQYAVDVVNAGKTVELQELLSEQLTKLDTDLSSYLEEGE
jgi:cell division protein ZapA (FtsZ GTPase activity inhibitor)